MPLHGFAFASTPKSLNTSFKRATWSSVSSRCFSNAIFKRSEVAALAIFGSAFTSCPSACSRSRSSSTSKSCNISGSVVVLVPRSSTAASARFGDRAEVLECRSLTNSHLAPSFHGPRASISPSSPCTGGVVEVLVDQHRCRRNLADREARLPQAFERGGEGLHVRDLTGHQELQRVLGPGIVAEVDEALVDDLGARFGGDVASKIDVEFARDLEVVRRPGIAHRVDTD